MSGKDEATRQLHVVLDTNIIRQTSGGEPVKREVCDLIKETLRHKDLIINWHLPEIVRNEREYQLRELAEESRGAVRKLERQLDSSFGMTQEKIFARIRQQIEGQLSELNVQILSLDTFAVDWIRIVSDTVFRQPPFAPGKHEKGFRDAIIVETFDQFLTSFQDDAVSQIALVTNDELLTKTIRARTAKTENVYVLSSTEDLKGLINTLVSDVDEDFLQRVTLAAEKFFYESKNLDTYIYKEKIKEKILQAFGSTINAIPEEADEVERGKALVGRPRFKEKLGERICTLSRRSCRPLRRRSPINNYQISKTALWRS